MILKGFKEKSNKKYLNKLLSERQVNVSNGAIKSLGIILNIDEVNDLEIFKSLAEVLKVRPGKLKIITFSEHIQEDLNSWDACYHPKDFGWNGAIKNVELQSVLSTEFDVLVSYYKKDILELKLLTALSKGQFKIGILQTDERLNDLIIKTSLKQFDLFKAEAFKYLSILNKIDNNE
ncbi:hypothetical protein VOI54_11665 [Tamlana sp. 2201CG12-4]|uniref:DUF6913 domain-containing protein n=1 Tax=Tamlana sp. 2201CG12-4 TaxID=3112582 RepID=UPI002DBA4B72|nr:hypothetical protein [Tamlana sp. 2201CG12-4]MEC3907678.1 hypothetical protein [Tamlana sp. 2201CG12-4]